MKRRDAFGAAVLLPLAAMAKDKDAQDSLTDAEIDAWVEQIESTNAGAPEETVASSLAIAMLASNLKARLGDDR